MTSKHKATGKTFIFIILLSIVILTGIILLGDYLYDTKGYSFLYPWADSPSYETARVIWNINTFVEKNLFNFKWPDVNIVDSEFPELSMAENQPYEEYGIHILEVGKRNQRILYMPNNFIDSSVIRRIIENKDLRTLEVVAVCVMAIREEPKGVYYPYNDYPQRYKEDIGYEAWKTWYFISWNAENSCTSIYYILSDIPPIPGCLEYTNLLNEKASKFFYPEEILPVFRTIYPNAEIPEEQILRKGRDY